MVQINNIHNPSNTQPYSITGYFYMSGVSTPSLTLTSTITMINPLAAVVFVPSYDFSTGATSSSVIQFRGNLYFPSNGVIEVNYTNLSLSYNGNVGASNSITILNWTTIIQPSSNLQLSLFNFVNPYY